VFSVGSGRVHSHTRAIKAVFTGDGLPRNCVSSGTTRKQRTVGRNFSTYQKAAPIWLPCYHQTPRSVCILPIEPKSITRRHLRIGRSGGEPVTTKSTVSKVRLVAFRTSGVPCCPLTGKRTPQDASKYEGLTYDLTHCEGRRKGEGLKKDICWSNRN
jgi:hypothetical protein